MLFQVVFWILFLAFTFCSNAFEAIIVSHLADTLSPLFNKEQLQLIMRIRNLPEAKKLKEFRFTSSGVKDFPGFLNSLLKVFKKINLKKFLLRNDNLLVFKTISMLTEYMRVAKEELLLEPNELKVLNDYLALLIGLHKDKPGFIRSLMEFDWVLKDNLKNLEACQDPNLKGSFILKQNFVALRDLAATPNLWKFWRKDNIYELVLRNRLLVRYMNYTNIQYGLFTSSFFDFQNVVDQVSTRNIRRDRVFKRILQQSLQVPSIEKQFIKSATVLPFNELVIFKNGKFGLPPLLNGYLQHVIFSSQEKSTQTTLMVAKSISEYLNGLYFLQDLFYDETYSPFQRDDFIEKSKVFQRSINRIFADSGNDKMLEILHKYLLESLDMQSFFIAYAVRGKHLPNILFLENFNELSSLTIENQIKEYLKLLPVWIGLCIKKSPGLYQMFKSRQTAKLLGILVDFLKSEIGMAFKIFSALDREKNKEPEDESRIFFSEEETFTFATCALLSWILNN
jgi:hypothetical protein